MCGNFKRGAKVKNLVLAILFLFNFQVLGAPRVSSGRKQPLCPNLAGAAETQSQPGASGTTITPADRAKFRSAELRALYPEIVSSDDQAGLNAVLGFYAEWIRKYKRLPAPSELAAFIAHVSLELKTAPSGVSLALMQNPESLYQGGIFSSLEDLVERVREKNGAAVEPVIQDMVKRTFQFIRFRLRPPTVGELARMLNTTDLELIRILTSRKSIFVEKGLQTELGRHLDYARKRVKIAYASAIRGTYTANANRTRKVEPTLRRMVEILIMTKSNEHYQWRAFLGDYGKYRLVDSDGNLDESELDKMMESLVGELKLILSGDGPDQSQNPRLEDRWVLSMPRLFPGGMTEVHESSLREYQPTFTSFVDIKNFSLEKAQHIQNLITHAPGFIVSEIKPGFKVNWDLLDGMIAYSKKNNYPLILVPADGMFQDLDPKILSHPDIHVLTAEISNNELALLLYPNNNRQEPFGAFKKQGMFRIGQQIILPHHTLAHEVIPTSSNHVNQTQLYTTGSVNLPEVPAVGKSAQAKAYQLARQIKPGFLVVEKIDLGPNRNDLGGVGNHWQARPVEFRFGKNQAPSVFVDRNAAYLIAKGQLGPGRVEIRSGSSPRSIVAPDLHLITADPEILSAFLDLLKQLVPDIKTPFAIVAPDALDSRSINGHVEKKQQDWKALGKMVRSGQIRFEDEINEAVGDINVLQKYFPNATFVFQYSNHTDEWITKNLINQPTWLQLVANGDLINEINFACRMNGWTPLEYLFIHREGFLRKANLSGNDGHYRQFVNFVSDPSRIRTMKMGDSLSSVDMDSDWNVTLEHHGHQGANGGKGAFKTHATSNSRAFTGDAHRMGYVMNGSNYYGDVPSAWIGVGSTSFRQPYSSGGYSSWGVGIGVVSEYGTMTLYQYDPNSKSFLQRKDIGPLPPEQFFGADPLRVRGAMDDDQRRRDIDQNEFKIWFKTQIQWIQGMMNDALPK